MAKLHGKTGAVYYGGWINATTISFAATTKIYDSAKLFVKSGFYPAQSITVSGSTSNDGTYTIATGGVAPGTLTVTASTIGNESAGDEVTIAANAPGTLGASFMNWEIEDTVDTHDVTDFDSVDVHDFHVGLDKWTGTAERWVTDAAATTDAWVGTNKYMRFFVKYVASPSAGDPAYYHEGVALITNVRTSAPANDMLRQTITFEGRATLSAIVTKTSSW